MELKDSIVVLTEDTVENILRNGGSGDWVLDPKRANKLKYLVCCRKPKWNNRHEGIADRSPFLIGEIKGFTERATGDTDRGQKRYLVEIANYALLKDVVPPKKEWRNPVAYSSLDALGIDASKLTFSEMLSAQTQQQPVAHSEKPLTIAEAKIGLAKTFGVRPEDVDITIRG